MTAITSPVVKGHSTIEQQQKPERHDHHFWGMVTVLQTTKAAVNADRSHCHDSILVTRVKFITSTASRTCKVHSGTRGQCNSCECEATWSHWSDSETSFRLCGIQRGRLSYSNCPKKLRSVCYPSLELGKARSPDPGCHTVSSCAFATCANHTNNEQNILTGRHVNTVNYVIDESPSHVSWPLTWTDNDCHALTGRAFTPEARLGSRDQLTSASTHWLLGDGSLHRI